MVQDGNEILLERGEAVDLRTITEFATGALEVFQKYPAVAFLSTSATQPTGEYKGVPLNENIGSKATLEATDTNAWVTYPYSTGHVYVRVV